MKKRENGVYVQVRIELDPLKVTELVNRYRLVEEVFRVQILAVDERREAILARQREEAARRAARAQEAEAAEAAE
jgi:ribosomal protein S6